MSGWLAGALVRSLPESDSGIRSTRATILGDFNGYFRRCNSISRLSSLSLGFSLSFALPSWSFPVMSKQRNRALGFRDFTEVCVIIPDDLKGHSF